MLGHQVNFAQISPTHQSPFKFPEETRGQNLFSKENEDVNETIDPCDRQPVVFRMEEKMEISSAEPIVELSEEDFELTPEDLQLYQKRLKEQRAYVTSSKENKERMRRAYVYSVVRFLLPDGHILQGTFKSLERVSVMYDFIKELLEDSNLSFTICK